MDNIIQYGVYHTFACILCANILLVKLNHMDKPKVKGLGKPFLPQWGGGLQSHKEKNVSTGKSEEVEPSRSSLCIDLPVIKSWKVL